MIKFFGMGFKVDHEAGAPLLEKASAAGYSAALFHCGAEKIARGLDKEQGVAYITASANQNFTAAQTALASLLMKGDIVPLDQPRAVELLRLAAAAGDEAAGTSMCDQ